MAARLEEALLLLLFSCGEWGQQAHLQRLQAAGWTPGHAPGTNALDS